MRHSYDDLRYFVLHGSLPEDRSRLLDCKVSEEVISNFHDSIIYLNAPFPLNRSRLDYSLDRKSVTVRIVDQGDTCRNKGGKVNVIDRKYLHYFGKTEILTNIPRFIEFIF